MRKSDTNTYQEPTGIHFYADISGFILARVNYDDPSDPITVVHTRNPGEVKICEAHTLLMEMVNDAIVFGTEVTAESFQEIACSVKQ